MDETTTIGEVLGRAAGALALLEQAVVGSDLRGLVYASGLLLGEVIDQLEAAAEMADAEAEEAN